MHRYCVILPIRTGEAKEILGNRVFYCEVHANSVSIFDDKKERKIHQVTTNDIAFVKESDVNFHTDYSMWLTN